MEKQETLKENNDLVMIPFVAHESSMNRMERTNNRLMWVAIGELIVIIGMFIGIMVYFYLPTEVVDNTQTIEDIDNSSINQNIGE